MKYYSLTGTLGRGISLKRPAYSGKSLSASVVVYIGSSFSNFRICRAAGESADGDKRNSELWEPVW
jgi:hypothetical protein